MNSYRKSLPIVVIDIDNTVANQESRINRFFNKKENTLDIESINSASEVLKDKVIKGASEAVKYISKNHQIYWLSARKHYLRKATLSWLLINKFMVDKLVLVEKFSDKIPFLIEWKPKLFIDDLEYDHFSMNPKSATMMIKKLGEKKIKFIVFNDNWDHIKSTYFS